MKTYKEFRKSIGFPVKEKKVEEAIRSEKPLKEDVVDQLRSVVKKKKESDIKFKSGTSVPIDPESANIILKTFDTLNSCLLYTSPSPRDGLLSRMPSSA